jgi:general secretion pathway protein N
MSSGLKWGLYCLLTYLIFLVVKLPAAKVLPLLPIPQALTITGLSGSIWQGQAQTVQYQGLPLRNFQWSLDFLPLLLGRVQAQIQAGNVRQPELIFVDTQLRISKNSLEAEDLLAYLPTNLVLSLLPLPIAVKAQGRFKIQLDRFQYSAACLQLKGQGQWLNASFQASNQTIELGDFNADLGCEDGNILLNVKSPNSFGLTAQARIPADQKFSIEGRFKPAPDLPKQVPQAATVFGQPDSNGYYPIQF